MDPITVSGINQKKKVANATSKNTFPSEFNSFSLLLFILS